MVKAVDDGLLFDDDSLTTALPFKLTGESGLTRALCVDDAIELSDAAESTLLKTDILFLRNDYNAQNIAELESKIIKFKDAIYF